VNYIHVMSVDCAGNIPERSKNGFWMTLKGVS